jgi:hypothetical protein
MPIAVDLTELPMEVRQKLRDVVTNECSMQIMQAKLRQAKVQKFYHDNRPRSIDGVGGLNMAVDPFWISYFNMMHGRQIWMDKDFAKWLGKQDDLFKPIRHTGTRLQFGYSPTNPTYRKKYD